MKLQQRSSESGRIEVPNTQLITSRQLQSEIGQLKLFISMRLHPVIFAFNSGTPFVALNYAPKVEQFCHETGIDSQLVDLNDNAWGRRISEFAELTLQQSTAFRRDCNAARAKVHARLSTAYDKLWRWLVPDNPSFPKSQEQYCEDLFSESAVS